jgi:hypothetical protein
VKNLFFGRMASARRPRGHGTSRHPVQAYPPDRASGVAPRCIRRWRARILHHPRPGLVPLRGDERGSALRKCVRSPRPKGIARAGSEPAPPRFRNGETVPAPAGRRHGSAITNIDPPDAAGRAMHGVPAPCRKAGPRARRPQWNRQCAARRAADAPPRCAGAGWPRMRRRSPSHAPPGAKRPATGRAGPAQPGRRSSTSAT